MTFYGNQFPALWFWLCWPLLTIFMVLSIKHFPLQQILADSRRLHLMLGSAIVMVLIWNMGARLDDHAVGIHLFLITAVVMLIGISPALISTALALILHTMTGDDIYWSAFAVNYVFGILPVLLVSAIALTIVSHMRQKNPFAYMLGAGFAGAIAARLVATLFLYLLLTWSGDSELASMARNYLPWMLLASFPEGFINGMIATGFAVFCPHLLRSFDEERYLGK